MGEIGNVLERTGRGTSLAIKKRVYQHILRLILNNCSLDAFVFEAICATEDEFRWLNPSNQDDNKFAEW